MAGRLAMIAGWAGGIYGIIRGIIMLSQPLYMRASSSRGPEPVPVDPVAAAFGIAIISLIFTGALALLTTHQREAFTGYALTLFTLSLLSLPSFGWIFLPATSLLLIAAILLWLPSASGENSART